MRPLPALFLLVLGCNKADPLVDFESEIPVVVIDTFGEEMGRREGGSVWDDQYVDARHQLWDAGSTTTTPLDDGHAAIRVRGNSSRDYDKRSFRLELRDDAGDDRDADLLGMSSDADWVLQAPYSDKTLFRNALIYGLSRDIGRYAPRTRAVELFVVDDRRPWSMDHHRGLYQLTERVERHSERVAIAKLEATDTNEPEVTGGYLLKRDWIEEDEGLVTTPIYGDELLLEDPKEPAAAQRSYITGYLGAFEEALSASDFATSQAYADLVDVDAFVDHLLLVELGRNVDGYVLSTWMHKDRGGRLAMGPIWDYNGALGNSDYFKAWQIEGWHFNNPEFPADNPQGFDWYARMLEDPAFTSRVAERWQTHRQGPWADSALEARIDGLVQELGVAPVERNFERWPVLGEYVWPNDEGHDQRQTHSDEVEYLRQWLISRATWLDGAVDSL